MPKSVQLSDDAYATLKALKREGESFSDVVQRLAAGHKDPRKLLLLPKPDPGWDYDRSHREAAAADRTRFKEIWGPAKRSRKKAR